MKKGQNLVGYVIILILFIIILVGFWYFTREEQPLIGGCAGVHPDYIQECCDRWLKDNNRFRVQCTGKWEIRDSECAWMCS